MLNIDEPKKTATGFFAKPIFNLAFRSFFLLASLASCISLAIWLGTLNSLPVLSTSGLSAMTWHAHEMIFGFAATFAVGFVLTAVQTWTGVSSVKGKPMAVLILLWLAIRASIWLNTETSIIAAIIITSLWWCMVIYHFSRIVFSAQNQRNYKFIPVLSTLFALNITMLISDFLGFAPFALHLAKTAVLLFCLIMGLVGGRVIPMFTVRGANTPPTKSYEFIEKWLLPLSALTSLLYLVSYFLPINKVMSLFLLVWSLLHFVRLTGWQGHRTGKVPLLWSLHLSYLAIPIGLLMLAMSFWLPKLSFSSGLHMLTTGAIGFMILAMITRISLGHTGRPLKPSPIMTFAFFTMIAAALTRVFLPLINLHMLGWQLSVLFWSVSFICFLLIYFPILTTARSDGKE